MYSLISILTRASSESNKASANARANSVFPTPVGPRKIKEPMGRFGLLSPARALRTALEIALTASSCPITLLWRISSNLRSFSLSSWAIFCTGIPVQEETIWAISSSDTFWISPTFLFFHSALMVFNSSLRVFSSSLNFAAFSKSCWTTADSFSLLIFSTFSSISFK